MSDHRFGKWLETLLSQDLSVGTEEFRETLLEDCIEAVVTSGKTIELDDDELQSLAAAGDMLDSSRTSPTEAMQRLQRRPIRLHR